MPRVIHFEISADDPQRAADFYSKIFGTIDVPSVDDYAAKITANGGKVVVPKMAIPGVGWLVYCQDTEGSVFGITEEDKSAK